MEKNSVVNTKNVYTKFHENILNDSWQVDVICHNRPQNPPKWSPEDGDTTTRKKIGLVIIMVMSRTSVRDFTTKYWIEIKENTSICQNWTQKYPKMARSQQGHCSSVVTISITPEKTVQNLMKKYWITLKK